MSSKVLDLTTLGHALTELTDTFLGDCEWTTINDQQAVFLLWYGAHRDEISKLDSLEALASIDYTVLNTFLTDHGFDPMFEPFKGFGAAAILDMLVEWIIEGTPTTISRYDSMTEPGATRLSAFKGASPVQYPAFKIVPAGVDIYDAAGYEHPLLRLNTKTGHSLWLMKSTEPESGIDLNMQVQQLLNRAELRPSLRWTAGAVIPMLEMDLDGDVEWMLGVTALSPTLGEYRLDQIFQKFKLRANAKGARVKVATGIVMRMANTSAIAPPPPYILDDPFLGFFTQPGNDTLPLAAFWADTDVWKNSGGTLEEL